MFKGDPDYGTGVSVGQGTAWSNLTEFNALSRFTWYETTSNRAKNVEGSASAWWERSPRCYNGDGFCAVGNASAGGSNASNARGLSPFGCL